MHYNKRQETFKGDKTTDASTSDMWEESRPFHHMPGEQCSKESGTCRIQEIPFICCRTIQKFRKYRLDLWKVRNWQNGWIFFICYNASHKPSKYSLDERFVSELAHRSFRNDVPGVHPYAGCLDASFRRQF